MEKVEKNLLIVVCFIIHYTPFIIFIVFPFTSNRVTTVFSVIPLMRKLSKKGMSKHQKHYLRYSLHYSAISYCNSAIQASLYD